MVLLFGRVLGITSIGLRYQNVYGPGQSLSNPYTGILAVFSNLARAGRPIPVFEDGLESRDFVFVDDVVGATTAAILADIQGFHAVNVGSGVSTTVHDVAKEVCRFFRTTSRIETTGAFREGDIRHGLADVTFARELFGYTPTCEFRTGLTRFLEWTGDREPTVAGYDVSLNEMRSRGLLHERR